MNEVIIFPKHIRRRIKLRRENNVLSLLKTLGVDK